MLASYGLPLVGKRFKAGLSSAGTIGVVGAWMDEHGHGTSTELASRKSWMMDDCFSPQARPFGFSLVLSSSQPKPSAALRVFEGHQF